MKTAVLSILVSLGVSLTVVRGDVLVNGDFSEGRAHWIGDAEETVAPDTSDSAENGSDSTPATGVTVTLSKDKWTMIYQGFTVRDPALYYTVTFKLSPDYKLADANKDDQLAADFSDVPGIMKLYTLPTARWSLIYTGTDPTNENSIKTKSLEPDATTTQSQTLTGKLINLNDGADANFVIAFPPGEGSVTLTTVQLSPDSPTAQP